MGCTGELLMVSTVQRETQGVQEHISKHMQLVLQTQLHSTYVSNYCSSVLTMVTPVKQMRAEMGSLQMKVTWTWKLFPRTLMMNITLPTAEDQQLPSYIMQCIKQMATLYSRQDKRWGLLPPADHSAE
jgi:hypothetical protein